METILLNQFAGMLIKGLKKQFKGKTLKTFNAAQLTCSTQLDEKREKNPKKRRFNNNDSELIGFMEKEFEIKEKKIKESDKEKDYLDEYFNEKDFEEKHIQQ